jgi:hypothetical protein
MKSKIDPCIYDPEVIPLLQELAQETGEEFVYCKLCAVPMLLCAGEAPVCKVCLGKDRSTYIRRTHKSKCPYCGTVSIKKANSKYCNQSCRRKQAIKKRKEKGGKRIV